MNVTGHAAIVTGGAQGLGAAAAAALAEAGARVAIIDVNETAANAMAERIGGLALCADVSDAAALEDAFARAHAEQGRARILIHCAGIAHAQRIVGREGAQPLEAFAHVIAVNLIGTFNALRLAAADMTQVSPLDDDERGVIVLTASIAAFEGQIGQAAYAASKGGVASLVVPSARELARFGVRVTAIAPGIIETPLLSSLPEAARNSLLDQIPFPRRSGRAEEFAALAMHIVTNTMLNGVTIRLDGAMRMGPS